MDRRDSEALDRRLTTDPANQPAVPDLVSECDVDGTCQYDVRCVFFAENCRLDTERR